MNELEDIAQNDINNNGVYNENNYQVLIDSLAAQYVSRMVRNGFDLNIMVLGQTGVGKTTLIDSLFNMKFPDVSTRSHNLSNIDVLTHYYELQERKIKLKFGLVEARIFADYSTKGQSCKSVVDYIDQQFERYLQEELKIHRNISGDTRIHVCIYLLSPDGYGLKEDLETMKQLDSKTNLIPVIAKSDTISLTKLDKLRVKIMSEITSSGINIYRFPTDDPEVAHLNSVSNTLIPFAVAASHHFVRVENKLILAQQQSWDTVGVQNEIDSDFALLQDILFRINTLDLKQTTHCRHYELYRRVRLEQMGFRHGKETPKTSPLQKTCEARRTAHLSATPTNIKFNLRGSVPSGSLYGRRHCFYSLDKKRKFEKRVRRSLNTAFIADNSFDLDDDTNSTAVSNFILQTSSQKKKKVRFNIE